MISKAIPLEYNLPSNVESIQQSWTRTCQASMIISGSLALLAPILLIFFKDNQGGAVALEIFGYAALFLNVSACMSGFILIDRLGNMPWDACQKEELLSVGKMITTQQQLLRRFGVGALWPWVAGHWLLCFTIGFFAIIAEILIYVWMNKSMEVKIPTIMLATFCLLPFLAFIVAPIVNWSVDTIFLSSQTDSMMTRSRSMSMVEVPQSPGNRQRRMTGQSIRTPISQHRISFPPIAENSKV